MLSAPGSPSRIAQLEILAWATEIPAAAPVVLEVIVLLTAVVCRYPKPLHPHQSSAAPGSILFGQSLLADGRRA